jgi:hypothetical protein
MFNMKVLLLFDSIDDLGSLSTFFTLLARLTATYARPQANMLASKLMAAWRLE